MENKKFTPVILKTISNNAKFPRKGTKLSAGHDLFAKEIIFPTENSAIVKLGLHFQPQSKHFKIVFVPRSSFTKTNWIMQNSPGQGDPDYTGEYQVRFRAIPTGINIKNIILNIFSNRKRNVFKYDPFPYKVGDRCAQMFLERIYRFKFEETTSLEETDRGSGGFGSTGNQ